jgi:uncharacterized protein YifE (UPF0438 family)
MNNQSVSCELEGERLHQREGSRDPVIISSYLLERERVERLQRAWEKAQERIKTDHELIQLRGIEAEKNLQEIYANEAVEEARNAAIVAKQKAFNKFKELVS